MKRRVFALALAGLMTFSMAACGNSGGSSSGGNAAAGTDEAAAEAEDKAVAGSEDAENKLVIWTLADDLKQFAEHYCEQNPDTQIETVVIAPADYLTKIQSAMRGKAKEPDIIVAEPQMLDTMYEAGYLEDLDQDPYNAQQYADNMVDYVWKAGQDADGVQRAISYQITPAAI